MNWHRQHRASYRAFREHAGEQPWACHFCGGPIERVGLVPYTRESFCLHHVDGDRTNNDASNLVPCHAACHQSFHAQEQRDARALERQSYLFAVKRDAAADVATR